MLLKEKVAIVTGASRGIGKAIATTFAKQGAQLVITGRSSAIHEVASELSTHGERVVAMQGDLREPAHRREVVMACRKTHGRLDILVNNAGVLIHGPLGMTLLESMRDAFETNVTAAMALTQYAIRLMSPARDPCVINLASFAGTRGQEGLAIYAASKAAVVGFTLSTAKELASQRIRVNAIAPGFIETDMTQALPEAIYRTMTERIRLGRIGVPQDVANCALFLASDLASYITGQVIGVDGGLLA